MSPVAVSFRTGQGRRRPQGQEGRTRGPGLLAYPCLQAVRLVAVPGESSHETVPSGGLGAAEKSHWKVLDMGWPLGSQLEELDVTPLNSINGHWG